MTSFRLKAGKYFIGNPCYVMGLGEHRSWIKVLEDSSYFDKPYERDGHTAIAFGTKWGDGVYHDLLGLSYCVDAGMIGAIPVELVEKEEHELGDVVNFSRDFDCYSENGILRFGHVTIDTDPDDCADDDECEEDCYDIFEEEEDEDEETIQ
jgi:hypothetical protein